MIDVIDTETLAYQVPNFHFLCTFFAYQVSNFHFLLTLLLSGLHIISTCIHYSWLKKYFLNPIDFTYFTRLLSILTFICFSPFKKTFLIPSYLVQSLAIYFTFFLQFEFHFYFYFHISFLLSTIIHSQPNSSLKPIQMPQDNGYFAVGGFDWNLQFNWYIFNF